MYVVCIMTVPNLQTWCNFMNAHESVEIMMTQNKNKNMQE